VTPAGRLVLVATPIGNLGDLSPRAREVLADADVVCCEDTRRTRQLLSYAAIRGKHLLSVHGHNERARLDEVVKLLEAGRTLALVSDAGMPALSDPGMRLVAAAADAGAEVTVVPGPNAALAALVLSGLPTERFCFEGFLPRRGPERRRRIAGLAAERRTALLHETAPRLAATLAELARVCGGDRRVAVARELTKLHEELWRGRLAEAADEFARRDVRGEIVVVLEGAADMEEASDDELLDAVSRATKAGMTLRDAAAAAAAELGVPRRRAYELALAARRTGSAGTGSAGTGSPGPGSPGPGSPGPGSPGGAGMERSGKGFDGGIDDER
jgi:16S rRNA (cytidine1402-2'-O)-methyltransferase